MFRLNNIYPPNLGGNYYKLKNTSTQVGMKISFDEESAPITIEKNKILGAVLELPAKCHTKLAHLPHF